MKHLRRGFGEIWSKYKNNIEENALENGHFVQASLS